MATNTISALQLPSFCRKANDFTLPHALNLKPDNLLGSSIGSKLSIWRNNPCRGVPKHRLSIVASEYLFRIPSVEPKKAGSEELPKWSARAIKARAMAECETRKLHYPHTGTECLLLGMLIDGTSLAAKFLRENGITYYKVQDEAMNVLGKSDVYYKRFMHPPLTKAAQRALDWAVNEKLKSGESGEITATHLLLGIWSVEESAGHKILANLGFDDEKAKELSKYINVDAIVSFKQGQEKVPDGEMVGALGP